MSCGFRLALGQARAAAQRVPVRVPRPGQRQAAVRVAAAAWGPVVLSPPWGGVGAAGAGVALRADAAPAPPVAVLRVTPNGVGMAGLTEYRFDANGSSDPNRDVLTYSLDFGDGGRGAGVTAAHIYTAAGTYEVTPPAESW